MNDTIRVEITHADGKSYLGHGQVRMWAAKKAADAEKADGHTSATRRRVYTSERTDQGTYLVTRTAEIR